MVFRQLIDMPHQHRTGLRGAKWQHKNVPKGLTIFALPNHHRRRLRTSNRIEQAIQQEFKRRTIKFRVFPSEVSLERLFSTALVENDKRSAVDTKAHFKWECQDT